MPLSGDMMRNNTPQVVSILRLPRGELRHSSDTKVANLRALAEKQDAYSHRDDISVVHIAVPRSKTDSNSAEGEYDRG